MPNPHIVIINCFSVVFLGQLYKFFSFKIKTGKFSVYGLIHSGGMPSTHTSCVTALVTSIALFEGVNNYWFVIALALALIVIYDAMGVRLEASKHAAILNRIVRDMRLINNDYDNDKELKELLGHKPIEVLFGFCLGIALPAIVWLIS